MRRDVLTAHNHFVPRLHLRYLLEILLFAGNFASLSSSDSADLFFLSPTFTSNSLPSSTGMVASMVAAKDATIISFWRLPSIKNYLDESVSLSLIPTVVVEEVGQGRLQPAQQDAQLGLDLGTLGTVQQLLHLGHVQAGLKKQTNTPLKSIP